MSSKKIETRNRILQTTWNLLELSQGDEIRMSDIAQVAGISRQALYLHFPTRAELLTATAKYLDEVNEIDTRLAPSRAATSGSDRLKKFVEAWGNYIPEIYGVGRALMAMKDTDAEAAAAWDDRMQAVRHGCQAAINALSKDKSLAPGLTKKQATDILWTLLSVRNWEQLTRECGWSQKDYIKYMQRTARRALVAE